jgi:ribosome maturation factor RimP
MSHTELTERILEEISGVAEAAGCELLECQFRGGVLRLVIERPGGVTLDDCQMVSKQASALLDVVDFGSGRYVLEVSSPGLDRKLYKDTDYERFCGSRVRVTWKAPEMQSKKTVVGVLADFSSDRRELKLEPSDGSDTQTIELRHIQLARLEPEF